ncbi:MAG: type II toxin-antitoxin system RelE/ParE family toxin [Hyphomicrobiaceae bacterium]
MKVRLIDTAEAELVEGAAYLAGKSPAAAAGFIEDIANARSLLLAFPGAGSVVTEATRRLLLKRYPYQLIQRIEGDEIVIYAIARLKRRPGYWLDRLPNG